LTERQDVLDFFRSRQQLAAFIGSYFPYVSNFDSIAYEYDIFGDFRADLAVGDSKNGQYAFIEFEDAGPDSIFRTRSNRSSSEWSPRFERGYSQVLDWLWKLSDMETTTEFENRFSPNYTRYEGMLIIGRTVDLSFKDTVRFNWRRDRVIVDSKQIHCITFDELYSDLDERLRFYEDAYEADTD
jgi:hypothetical protein